MHKLPWLFWTLLLLSSGCERISASNQDELATAPRYGDATIREPGRCSLGQDTCGSKGGVFGEPLPCVANEPAQPLDATLRAAIDSVCGPDVAATWTSSCCNSAAVDKLSQSLQQASAFIALCPACEISFKRYYCQFTCSPNQSEFVTISQTQDLGDKKGPAVKSLELHVDEAFGRAFFDACKNVAFAQTNGFALDFIGGGAKDWLSFLRYMGQERPGLGSPFQINIPSPSNTYNGTIDPKITPLSPPQLSCASRDPAVGCACADCPERCLALPDLPDQAGSRCHVGLLSCGSFFLVLAYSLLLLSFVAGVGIRDLWHRRHAFFSNRSGGRIQLPSSPGGYDRMDLDPPEDGEDGDTPLQASASGQKFRSTMRNLFGGQPRSHSSEGDGSSNRQRPQSGASSANMADSDSNANSLSRRQLGRGASLLSPDVLAAYSQPRKYRLNAILSNAFYRLGHACASWPVTTIAVGLTICGVLNAGWSKFSVEKDPVRLWVPPKSDLAVQKAYFEEHFGPFYRTEQVFLSKADGQAVLDFDTLQWWAGVEQEIRDLVSPAGTMLKDVCFAPTAEDSNGPDVSDCTVQSFLGYFKDSLDGLTPENWQVKLNSCASSPSGCLSSAGQPLNPRLLFGGIPGCSGNRTESAVSNVSASEARAVVITYVVNNSVDKATIRTAAEWERTLQHYLANLQRIAKDEHGLTMAYSTEISLEQELSASTNTDVPIVVISYLSMFVYVAVSLGGTRVGLVRVVCALVMLVATKLGSRSHKTGPIALERSRERTASGSSIASIASMSLKTALQSLLVDSKFLLALFGIAIVLLSVSTAVAIFSALGVKTTLIIAEVIPFLVLAIGVDNVYILAHELERQNHRAYSGATRSATDEYFDNQDIAPAEERIARALGRMGPSILLSASCQSLAFALGAAVGMPAVRNFAIYAAGSVLINATLQVTIFVAAMCIDLKRIESNRADLFPCIRFADNADKPVGSPESIIVRFIRNYYAPLLLRERVKYAVLAIFSGLFVASWVCTDYIQLGLDQRLALPPHSYLTSYFDSLDKYLDVGPPVYFVVDDVDVEHRSGQQALCGRFSTCDQLSVANLLEAERKRPDTSYLAEAPAAWIDDFFQWLNPGLEACCSVKKRDPSTFCTPNDNELLCKPCYEDKEPGWNITMEGLPEGQEFVQYLQQWLASPANQDCALGGKTGYSSALKLQHKHVQASHFRTYHTPLKTQNDYIQALASAKRISADLEARTGGRVFPYSIFYVFFEQYATIVTNTRSVVAAALVAIFLVSSLLLGSWRTGAVIVVSVFSISMNVLGVMGLWHISLNAISLVNLSISIGLGVEFCTHIARAFMGAGAGGGAGLPHSHPAGRKERDDRAYAALVDVGSSVFSGITLTKCIGLGVLSATRSKLLETYFVKPWAITILSGALHGLVFLPVALSFHGGNGYSLQDDKDDEDYIEEVARYRGQPFYNADDDGSVASDDM